MLIKNIVMQFERINVGTDFNMINLPQQYKINKKIALKTILSGEMKPAEKKRMKSNLIELFLTHQISGESIPSWIDEDHRYEVIMFFDVQVEKTKQVESTASVLQRFIKPPCVIRFHDNHEEIFSFAHKKINPANNHEMILENRVITPPQPVSSKNAQKDLLTKSLDFDSMKSRTNKKDLYVEAMTKAFIAAHPNIFSRVTEFLDSSIWYNSGDVLELLENLTILQDLNRQKAKALQVKDKVLVNGKIKKIISGLTSKLQ
ncbi:MAG: DUF4391 domain-containing protein [Desulfamplus sp.]|nr:DUF4391 domain-containing protein [Desulfamplus sp.]